MALESPEAGFIWGKVPLEGDLVITVVGDIQTYWSHWDRVPGRGPAQMVRCARAEGVACAWCDAGYPRRARYVFPALLDGELRVWEMGRVQFPTLKLLAAEGWLGRVLRIRRAFRAKNAEILVFPAGRQSVGEEVVCDVSDFVAALGQGQMRLLPKPDRVSPSERSSVQDAPLRSVPRDR